jgi:hypothetical protein
VFSSSACWWRPLKCDSEVRVRLPEPPHFLRSGGSEAGFNKSLEYN